MSHEYTKPFPSLYECRTVPRIPPSSRMRVFLAQREEMLAPCRGGLDIAGPRPREMGSSWGADPGDEGQSDQARLVLAPPRRPRPLPIAL